MAVKNSQALFCLPRRLARLGMPAGPLPPVVDVESKGETFKLERKRNVSRVIPDHKSIPSKVGKNL